MAHAAGGTSATQATTNTRGGGHQLGNRTASLIFNDGDKLRIARMQLSRASYVLDRHMGPNNLPDQHETRACPNGCAWRRMLYLGPRQPDIPVDDDQETYPVQCQGYRRGEPMARGIHGPREPGFTDKGRPLRGERPPLAVIHARMSAPIGLFADIDGFNQPPELWIEADNGDAVRAVITDFKSYPNAPGWEYGNHFHNSWAEIAASPE
jgi:hypothetical protein